MQQKVLVIGLDGATWDLIKPWAEEGKLPTFKKLMENGVWGYLESTIPPWTSPAWESLCTGKTPATLDAGLFLIKKGDRFVPISYIVEKELKIWDFLSLNNFRVFVANIPCLIRPYKINGYLIVGFGYKNGDITYPPSLIKELNKISNGYQIDIVKIGKKGITYCPSKENIFGECEKLFEKHFKAFSYILLNKKWDFGFIVFVTPDRIQHKLWDEKEKILKHYETIDKEFSKLVQKLKNVNIFVISDHGFGKVNHVFRTNDWLIKEGYLKLKNTSFNFNFLLFKILKNKNRKFLENLVKLLPESIKSKFFKKIVKNFFETEIDWKNTKAFSYGSMGEIYINFKERYHNGCVGIKEYYKLRNEIIKKIKNLENNFPGKKLKIKVFKKEEIYPNAKPEDSVPDIIILPTDDGIHAFSSSIGYDEVFSTFSSNTGNHRLYGIFLAYGKDIKNTGEEIKNIKIYDIAPTILHMFGLPIPKDMDGRVLTEIFREDSEIAKRKPVFVEPSYYSEKLKLTSEKERIRERLKKLKDKGKV